MKPRHWEKIGLVMNKPIAPVQEMSLAEMVQLDIGSNISKIEEIAASASKEFLFENTMNKMKEEWEKLTVELIQYQDTEKRVLSSCEDIQTLLDENILRIQTIGSSPFAEPMKKEIKDWETMLVLIQDILDAWFKCQSSWIYLEPIFNSEDIMRQMPEEGQKFSIVDEICCNITKRLESNNNLLLSICEQETLTQLNEANDFLEDIQKGLNEYLEKKRMKFPRFYFISNDELLEILSETKEPQRVQPHLKKCFEGIAHLRFVDEDEIIGMVSAEDEIVPFSQHIFPEQSKWPFKILKKLEDNNQRNYYIFINQLANYFHQLKQRKKEDIRDFHDFHVNCKNSMTFQSWKVSSQNSRAFHDCKNPAEKDNITKTGKGGMGKFTELDGIVLDIIGKDSPLILGLVVKESLAPMESKWSLKLFQEKAAPQCF